MSRSIRNILAAMFVISAFTFLEPSCLSLTTAKVYADEKPHLKNIYFSEGNEIKFSEDVYSYVIDVNKDIDEAFIKARPDDPLDTVRINGKVVTKENYYKQDIALNEGKNKIRIEVEDYKTKITSAYYVYVYRGGQNAVYLNDITINSSIIGFAPTTTSYNIELDEGTGIINLYAIPYDENYTVTVNGSEFNTEHYKKLKFNGIGKYDLNISVKDEETGRIGNYILNIYLGIPVSPNVSGSINAVKKPNQWVMVNGRWRYNDTLGNNLKNIWFYDNKYKSYFHFNSRGNMQTGWTSIDNNLYYLSPSGAMQTKWVLDENEWYYFGNDGIMRTGWVEDDNKWYYLRKDGTMATGWIVDNGKWYYLNRSGVMWTGWLYYGKKWYLMDYTGAMQIGWVQSGDEWYCLNFDGSMKEGEWVYSEQKWYYITYAGNMKRGWLKKDDKIYYFNEDGTLQTNPKTIDGYTYSFDEDGSLNLDE